MLGATFLVALLPAQTARSAGVPAIRDSWNDSQVLAQSPGISKAPDKLGSAGARGGAAGKAETAPADPAVNPDAIIGMAVVDTDGQEIGEVENLLVDPLTAEPVEAIVESGGFLGIGDRHIAIDLDSIEFAVTEEGEESVRVRDMTADQIERMDDVEVTDPGRLYEPR